MLLLCAASMAQAQPSTSKPTFSLIPLPAHVVQNEGTFTFGHTTSAWADAYPGDSIQMVLNQFSEKFSTVTGLKVRKGRSNADIQLHLNRQLGKEAYRLNVTTKRILIEAARPAGFFYALQTLQQLLPSRTVLAGTCHDEQTKTWTLPTVDIEDSPHFGWRGFMLDEGRHFFGKEEIKKLLDVMASYKMNRFHWHLTEDQGWRIEIKKYPRLTEVGAWRNSKVLGWGDTKPDGQRYGGYLSLIHI